MQDFQCKTMPPERDRSAVDAPHCARPHLTVRPQAIASTMPHAPGEFNSRQAALTAASRYAGRCDIPATVRRPVSASFCLLSSSRCCAAPERCDLNLGLPSCERVVLRRKLMARAADLRFGGRPVRPSPLSSKALDRPISSSPGVMIRAMIWIRVDARTAAIVHRDITETWWNPRGKCDVG